MVPNKQNIGENMIAKVPKEIATYLKKPHPEEYTSHCFRRTAATILAESGASLPELKIAGSWNSSTTAESYISTSLRTKRTISDKMKL
jgi:integrase